MIYGFIYFFLCYYKSLSYFLLSLIPEKCILDKGHINFVVFFVRARVCPADKAMLLNMSKQSSAIKEDRDYQLSSSKLFQN